MSKRRTLAFTSKLLLSLCVVGTVPLVVLTGFALASLERTSEVISETYHEHSRAVLDLIDRNLFERYGDVQAPRTLEYGDATQRVFEDTLVRPSLEEQAMVEALPLSSKGLTPGQPVDVTPLKVATK